MFILDRQVTDVLKLGLYCAALGSAGDQVQSRCEGKPLFLSLHGPQCHCANLSPRGWGSVPRTHGIEFQILTCILTLERELGMELVSTKSVWFCLEHFGVYQQSHLSFLAMYGSSM